jgi:hypothetical protein
MKKIFPIILATIAAVLLFAMPVYAAEITPDSSTYSYGSTSEFSPSVNTDTSETSLAPTGESTMPFYLAASSMIIVAIVLCALALRHTHTKGKKLVV